MSRTQQAVKWLRSAPHGEIRTQAQAAELFGITQPTISAAIKRGPSMIEREREECAALAVMMGNSDIAEAIRNRGNL